MNEEIEESEEKTKKCILCNNILPLNMFPKQKRKYHLSYCRECNNKKSGERFKRLNKERDLEFSNIEYGENNFKCECCKEIKDKSKFNRNRKTKFGIKRICSKCIVSKRNEEKEDEINKDYYSDIEIKLSNDLTTKQILLVSIRNLDRIQKNHDGFFDAFEELQKYIDLRLK